MTSSLLPSAPLAILWADHVGKTTLKSQPVFMQWGLVQNPTSCLDDSLRFFLLLFPSNSVMAEQNFQSWALDMSPPSPQMVSFSN